VPAHEEIDEGERKKGRCVCVCVYVCVCGRRVSFVVAAVEAGSCYVEVPAAKPARLRPGIFTTTQCLKLSGYSAHFLSPNFFCTAVLSASLSDATGWCGNWRQRRRSARDGAMSKAINCRVLVVKVSLAFSTPFGHAGW